MKIVNFNNKMLIDTFKVLFFWLVAFLFAWLLGKFSWAILEILFSSFREPKTGNAYIYEIQDTLFVTRIAFLGATLVSIILLLMSFTRLADLKIDTNKLMVGGFLPYSLLLILTAYTVIAWNNQSVYWMYTKPIPIYVTSEIESAVLIIAYNAIRATSIFFILALEPWKYVFIKFPMSLSTRLFLGRIGSLGVIHLLSYWSSVPNANLGLPATIILAVLAALIGIFSVKHPKVLLEIKVEASEHA